MLSTIVHLFSFLHFYIKFPKPPSHLEISTIAWEWTTTSHFCFHPPGIFLLFKWKRKERSIFWNLERWTALSHNCINQWNGQKYRNVWTAASYTRNYFQDWLVCVEDFRQEEKCGHVTISPPLVNILIPLVRNWQGSHLRIHMDEAVRALQRECSSANHSAVVEVVMVVQTSYLTKQIQTATTRWWQQTHWNISYKKIRLNILSIWADVIQMAFTLMWLGLFYIENTFETFVCDAINIRVLSRLYS